MIIDKTDNVLDHWEDSGRRLIIKTKDGNNKSGKATEIINSMSKKGHSILILSNEFKIWNNGLNKDSETNIIDFKYVSEQPEIKFKTDMLVIHNSNDMPKDFPLENIEYKFILILSDNSNRGPDFHNCETIQLIDWDNVNERIEKGDLIYKAISDQEGNIIIVKIKNSLNTVTTMTVPVETLKELLLN